MNHLRIQATSWIDNIVAAYGNGKSLALLFDYDGTLTPIVRHPSLARLGDANRHILNQLVLLPQVEIGVISARALSEVQTLVGLDRAFYAGSGGLEMDLRGEQLRYPEIYAIGLLLEEIQSPLIELMEEFPGTWMERKPGALALHFRGLLPLSSTCFRYSAAEILSHYEALAFRVVSEAIEVTPRHGWDKGIAVATIISHLESSTKDHPLVVYFGDSANDLEGMLVANSMNGVTVGVGIDAPENADHNVSNPDVLTECLTRLLYDLVKCRGLSYSAQTLRLLPQPDRVCPDVVQTVHQDAGILLLDPDTVDRANLATSLLALGWQVWLADTPDQASEQLAAHGHEIDVALVDLHLPGLQGARAINEIGERNPRLIRCYQTAELSPYMAAAFSRLSTLPLLIKPFHPVELDRFFRTLMNRKHSVNDEGEAEERNEDNFVSTISYKRVWNNDLGTPSLR